METHQIRILWGVGSWAGCVLASTANEAGSRTLEKSSRRDRDWDCAKFKSSRWFRGSNMKPKKKSLRCRGLGLDSGLDLAISRFIHSLVHNTVLDSEARYHGTAWYKRLGTIRGSGSATKWHGSPTLFKIILDQGSQSSKVPGSD
jgi:hypothetical protein